MDGALLKYATAQPLMRIDDSGTPHYFFFAVEGMKPEFVVNDKIYHPQPGLKSTFSVKGINGKVKVTILTRAQALNASKVGGRLLITDAMTLPYSETEVTLVQMDKTKFDYILYPSKAGFKTQSIFVEAAAPEIKWEKHATRRMTLSFDPTLSLPQVNEWFLEVDYTGDVAMAFLDNHLVLDHFYFGQPWCIGLKRFPQMASQPMSFYFRPIKEGATFLIDLPADKQPDLTNGDVLNINGVRIIPQYKTIIKL